MGLSLQMLLQFFTNIRLEAWNAFPSPTTAENSRVLLSAALPLKQSPCTESRHQSGRQSAYNLSHIHWPTKSHRFTVLVFLSMTSANGLFFFFYVFSSLPNPWYFFFSINQVILSHMQHRTLGCPVTPRHLLQHVVIPLQSVFYEA